jgi:hypothetical protein
MSVVLIFKNVALHICRILFNEIPHYMWFISSVHNFWVEIWVQNELFMKNWWKEEVLQKDRRSWKKLKPKEVFPAIAPLISIERREKMDMGARRGPAARSPKGGPILNCHVGGWAGPPVKGSPTFGTTPKMGGQPIIGAGSCLVPRVPWSTWALSHGAGVDPVAGPPRQGVAGHAAAYQVMAGLFKKKLFCSLFFRLLKPLHVARTWKLWENGFIRLELIGPYFISHVLSTFYASDPPESLLQISPNLIYNFLKLTQP